VDARIVTPRGDWLRPQARRRRTVFFSLTVLTAIVATTMMWDILAANGLNALDRAGLVLFFILFLWLASSFWTAVAGFAVRWRGGDRAQIAERWRAVAPLRGRTAVIMPIYNEDTTRVAAGLEVIWSSLQALAEQSAFDLFILSDTRKRDIGLAEEAAWRDLVTRHNARGRIFYRRRPENIARKAGNIADFVNHWGGAYDYAVVLDADSIMSGVTILEMARLMDANPRTGIIQALPLPAGRDTLFARLIQFAARLSSPMLSSGLAYWQLGESNYWGHNAIIRLKAFAAHCGLPHLPGSAPLGGEILSHDFVEAAFMRRAGYEVWLLPIEHGSWEEIPSNVVDYAARDRRWAQGNIQHLGLLPARGLYWLNRIHLIGGVLSYLASPLWLLMLLLSSTVVILQAIHGHQYFLPGQHGLFPNWPHYRDGEIAALLSLTAVALFGPKILAVVLTVRDPKLRRGFGGASRVCWSLLIEQLFSVLLAPAMMLFHTAFVVSTLAGKPVSWHAQERGDRGIGFLEALRRHAWHVLIGLTWGALILRFAPHYIGWLLPVIIGMVLSVPITMFTSRIAPAYWLRRHRLLLTPEETDPPAELRALQTCLIHHTPPARPALGEAAAARELLRDLEHRVPAHVPLAMKAQPLHYVAGAHRAGDAQRRRWLTPWRKS
jgi:membrane glycosyltransferase